DETLQPPHAGDEYQRQDEVDDERQRIDGHRLEGEVPQVLCSEGEVGKGDQGDQGGVLQVLHDEVLHRWHHLHQRLGEDNVPQRVAAGEVEGAGRLILAGGYGLDGAPNDLCAVRANVEG